MSAILLSLAAVAQTATIDWEALPPLPFRAQPVVTVQMTGFVVRAARSRRCPVAPPTGGIHSISVDVAVLVDADGGIRTTVPRAIQCATVEQYASGLVSSFARNNLLPRQGGTEQWYRTRLTFSWRK